MMSSIEDQTKAVGNLIAAQIALNIEIAKTIGSVAGVLLRLRSHERAVDNHDDVTVVLTKEVVAWIDGYIADVTSYLKKIKSGSCITVAAGAALTVELRRLRNHHDLADIFNKYVVGYESKMTRFILMKAGAAVSKQLHTLVGAGAELITIAGYAKSISAIDNNDEVEIVTDQFVHLSTFIGKEVIRCVDTITPALDKVAADENAGYNKLLVSGMSAADAMIAINKDLGDNLSKALEESKDE
jgi:hypothetical protein